MSDTIKQFLEMYASLLDNNIKQFLERADEQLSLRFYNELVKILVDCDILTDSDKKYIGNPEDFPNRHIDWDNPSIYDECQEYLTQYFEKHITMGSGMQVSADILYNELEFNGEFHLWDLDLIYPDDPTNKVTFVSFGYSLEDPDGYIIPEILCFNSESKIVLRLTENNRDEYLGGYIDDVGIYYNSKRLRNKLERIKQQFESCYDLALQNAKEEE